MAKKKKNTRKKVAKPLASATMPAPSIVETHYDTDIEDDYVPQEKSAVEIETEFYDKETIDLFTKAREKKACKGCEVIDRKLTINYCMFGLIALVLLTLFTAYRRGTMKPATIAFLLGGSMVILYETILRTYKLKQLKKDLIK